MERAPQNVCCQMVLDSQFVVLDAFCGVKNTQKSILAGALPQTPLGQLTLLAHTL